AQPTVVGGVVEAGPEFGQQTGVGQAAREVADEGVAGRMGVKNHAGDESRKNETIYNSTQMRRRSQVTPERLITTGEPATRTWAGTSPTTRERAATTEPEPMRAPFETHAPEPYHTWSPRMMSRAGLSRSPEAASRSEWLSLLLTSAPLP